MKARRPSFDYAETSANWSGQLEYSHNFNSGSVILPYLEPYLNRVMAKAKEQMGDKHPEVVEEINIFMLQEANHYRQHRLHTQKLYDRYPELSKLEVKLRTEFERLLATKSLEFNCAYCEGFESVGLLNGEYFFEHNDEYLKNADPIVAELWKWHLAEEYEHRMVCYDAYKTLFGGYFMRIYGLFYSLMHLEKMHIAVANYMLDEDRKRMAPEDVKKSKRAYRRYGLRMAMFVVPRMVFRIMSPFYNPKGVRQPEGAREALMRIETQHANAA